MSGLTRLVAKPLPIAFSGPSSGTKSTGVSAFGVEPGSALAPESSKIGGNAAVLSATAAEELGVAPGVQFTLAGQDLVVAGVGGDASFSHTPVIWTSLDTWQKTAPPTSRGDGPTASVAGEELHHRPHALGGEDVPLPGDHRAEHGAGGRRGAW
ncbi:ABC transporter permease [Saccharopolyspora tripterygii]